VNTKMNPKILQDIGHTDLTLVDTSFFSCSDLAESLYEINSHSQLRTFVPTIQQWLPEHHLQLEQIVRNPKVFTVPGVPEEMTGLVIHLNQVHHFQKRHLTTHQHRKNTRKIDGPSNSGALQTLKELAEVYQQIIDELKIYSGPSIPIPRNIEASVTDYALVEAANGYLTQNQNSQMLLFTQDKHLPKIWDKYCLTTHPGNDFKERLKINNCGSQPSSTPVVDIYQALQMLKSRAKR